MSIRGFTPVCLVLAFWASMQLTVPRRALRLHISRDEQDALFVYKKHKSNIHHDMNSVGDRGTLLQLKKKRRALTHKHDLRKINQINKNDTVVKRQATEQQDEESVDTFDWKSHVRFFVLGVQKGGTTSLYKYMGQHPQIARPAPKELKCFNHQWEPWDPTCARHFSQTWLRERHKDYITGDFSPGYIYSQKAVRRIKRAYPDARFIVTLRNPVERGLSQYRMHERNKKLPPDADFELFCLMELEILREVGLLSHWTFPPTFDDSKEYSDEVLREMYLLASVNETKFVSDFGSPAMLKAWSELHHTPMPSAGILRTGLYAPQLHQWLGKFPREQFLVVSLEETARDTQGVMERIHAHLGLQHIAINDTAAANKGNNTAAPISEPMRQILTKLFRPFDNMIGPLLNDESWQVPWTL